MTKFDFLDRADAGRQMYEKFGAEISNHDLLVPICPRPVIPQLLQVYDAVHCVVSPLAPRSLTWHYEVN